MVNHAPVIYSYSLACCSGGGTQQSVDNYIDSTWKEIKNLSMTTKYVFSCYRNISLFCSESTVAFLVFFAQQSNFSASLLRSSSHLCPSIYLFRLNSILTLHTCSSASLKFFHFFLILMSNVTQNQLQLLHGRQMITRSVERPLCFTQ